MVGTLLIALGWAGIWKVGRRIVQRSGKSINFILFLMMNTYPCWRKKRKNGGSLKCKASPLSVATGSRSQSWKMVFEWGGGSRRGGRKRPLVNCAVCVSYCIVLCYGLLYYTIVLCDYIITSLHYHSITVLQYIAVFRRYSITLLKYYSITMLR